MTAKMTDEDVYRFWAEVMRLVEEGGGDTNRVGRLWCEFLELDLDSKGRQLFYHASPQDVADDLLTEYGM